MCCIARLPCRRILPGPGRAHAVNSCVRACSPNGKLALFPNQSSGVLTSCAWADGLVDIGVGETVQPGDWVRFIPFSELLK